MDQQTPTGFCYSDTTSNRLLPFKHDLDYQDYISDAKPRQAYAMACKNGCLAEEYAYGGIQLTQQKDGLECWCGDTQPLKWVSNSKTWIWNNN